MSWCPATIPTLAPGTEVLAHGGDLGVARHGGFARYARVPAGTALALPDGLSARQAMAIGTAGFTAALSLDQLEHHGLPPGDGPVLVTGASGGVGSFAVALLAARGYEVVASTGKADEHAWLESLGAARGHRARRPGRGRRPGARSRALGGRRRLRRRRDPGPDPAVAALRGGGGRQRAHGRHGPADDGVPLHHPGRGPARGGLGRTPVETTTPGVGAPGHGSGAAPDLEDLVAAEVPLEGVAGALADILASRVRGRLLVRVRHAERLRAWRWGTPPGGMGAGRGSLRPGAARWSGSPVSPRRTRVRR